MQGTMLIDGKPRFGAGISFHGIEASTGEAMAPAYGSALPQDVDDAADAAARAFRVYRNTPRVERAALLERIADNIVAVGEQLLDRAMKETGLPRGRLDGELARTVSQLRMFADVVRKGDYLDRRHVAALPDRQPFPRPDLRLMNVPLGPVAVFGASNFPLAFSVAGGDTASALAAGCPVVVKAHPAHPGTSELVAGAVADAVAASGLPAGVFGILFDSGIEAGSRLVADPRIKAVGFTGSARAGKALLRIAQTRPEPIPVYAEMSAINPVLLFPAALEERAEAIAAAFVPALTGSCGQMCTAPGLLIAVAGPALDRFLATAGEKVASTPAATMLTPAIAANHRDGALRLAAMPAVTAIAVGGAAGFREGQAGLYCVDAPAFISNTALAEEVFGPTALVVRCSDLGEMAAVLLSIGGQLTLSVHVADDDVVAVHAMWPLIEDKAGRIINGAFGTGVEVCEAMVHGGPWPATSDPRTTSVGTRAIDRFVRPVCYQNLPAALVPPDLR